MGAVLKSGLSRAEFVEWSPNVEKGIEGQHPTWAPSSTMARMTAEMVRNVNLSGRVARSSFWIGAEWYCSVLHVHPFLVPWPTASDRPPIVKAPSARTIRPCDLPCCGVGKPMIHAEIPLLVSRFERAKPSHLSSVSGYWRLLHYPVKKYCRVRGGAKADIMARSQSAITGSWRPTYLFPLLLWVGIVRVIPVNQTRGRSQLGCM